MAKRAERKIKTSSIKSNFEENEQNRKPVSPEKGLYLDKESAESEIKIAQKYFDNPVVDHSSKLLEVIKAFGIKYGETTIDEEQEIRIRNKYLGKNSIYMITFVYNNIVLLHFSSISDRNKICITQNTIPLSGETEFSKFHKYYKESNYYCIPVYNPVLESLFSSE